MIAVDLFAGGGGASEGIRLATGQAPVVAINHDSDAIRMHAANHPGTLHLCEDLFRVTPFRPRRKPIDLLWASPDCKDHSKAKGGKPKDARIRMLAWVVVEWARSVTPAVICLENVEEFADWGPLLASGDPDPMRRGETFREFVASLRLAGYRVEWRELAARDYGVPTTRNRLYLIARCDGEAIVWPEATHGKGLLPYVTAGERVIDWTLPVPSIFGRKRPHVEATQARIARGLRRFVFEAANPYIAPVIANNPADPRLVCAWVAKHYGGMTGHDLRRPLGTITKVDHHSLCLAYLHQLSHGGRDRSLTRPLQTITATPRGGDTALVTAFLTKFYGQGGAQGVDEPLHTITTKSRFGLVTVTINGETYTLDDIGMRMLAPRELARAQGFRDDYILTGTIADQIARIGNSVCPEVAAAIVRAQFGISRPAERMAA